MARLTRMQKYADLREQLSNSKEETSISQELKAYEDKLTNVQDTLTPKQEVEEDPRYIWNEFHDEIQDEPVSEATGEVSIGENLNTVETINEPVVETIKEPVVETANEQNTVKENSQTVSSYFDSFFSEVKEEPATNVFGDFNSYFDNYNQTTAQPTAEATVTSKEENNTVVEPVVEKVEEPVVINTTVEPEKVVEENITEPEKVIFEDATDKFENNTVENTIVEPENVVEEKVVENENVTNVFDDVTDNSEEIVSQKERDTYLNQTFSDVNLYNIDKGEVTIDKLLDDSIDEVRHHKSVDDDMVETFAQIDNLNSSVEEIRKVNDTEETELLDADVITEKVDEQTNGMNDDEFSSTVSLEITKIMEELSANTEEENIAIDDLNKNIKAEDDEQQDNIVVEPIEVENQSVEEKTEDVVEIKNISELENDSTPVNTMSTTIPFVVTDDNDSIEDDEENGSNTVLNVILIVLIVILVAVLGLIVFYILKTKGLF